MDRPGKRGAEVNATGSESLDFARLDLGNRHQIDTICVAFDCLPTDVYIAVSMVGDKVTDVRRHLLQRLGRDDDGRPRLRAVARALPPPWPTVS